MDAPGRPAHAGSRASRRTPRWAWALVFALAAVAIVALEHVWRGESYWNFSEGVYLVTARAVLDGEDLYAGIAAAQPPPLFYLGAGLMAISESLLFVRGALGLSTVAVGALVAVIVGRITGRPAVGVAAGLAALLTPWTVREHATLTPDPLAAAPLLGAALLAARPGSRAAAIGGALAALAAALKLAFLLPLAAIAVAARRRGPFLAGALVAGAALAVASFAAWGPPVWDNLVSAQRETGFQLGSLPGLFGQSVWNIGPLVALGALAVLARGHARDPALFRSLVALLAGSLALGVTFLKGGTYLNTLAVVEPAAVALAAVGLTWFLEDRSLLGGRRRLASVAVGAACAVVVLQSAVLFARPEGPFGFGNPFLSRDPGHELSEDQVRLAADRAGECPPGAPYSGSPFVAFVAGRTVPGGQPDRFIVGEAEVHADLRAQVGADGPLCPYRTLGGLPEGGSVVGRPRLK